MRGLGTDHVITVRATDAPPTCFARNGLLAPPQNSAKIIETKEEKNCVIAWEILGGRKLTRSLHNLRNRVFMNVTDIHTIGHCDSMTELAQWGDSVKTHCKIAKRCPEFISSDVKV